MLELDEATRRALSQRYGPTPDAQARVLDGLRSTLAGPVGPDGGGEGGPPTGAPPVGDGQVVWIAKICAATAGLTGAGLLVLKLGATVLGADDVREPEVAPAKLDVNEPARVTPPVSDERETAVAADSKLPVARPVPVQTPTKRTDASSSLAAELALIDAAQRLRDSDPKAALARLEQHREDFPAGVLAPEREALRIEVSRALESGIASGKTGD